MPRVFSAELSPEAKAHLAWLRQTSAEEIGHAYHGHTLVRHMQLTNELSDDASAYLRDLRASII